MEMIEKLKRITDLSFIRALRLIKSIKGDKRTYNLEISPEELGHLNFITAQHELRINSSLDYICGEWIDGLFILDIAKSKLLINSGYDWANFDVSHAFVYKLRSWANRKQTKFINNVLSNYIRWGRKFSITTNELIK